MSDERFNELYRWTQNCRDATASSAVHLKSHRAITDLEIDKFVRKFDVDVWNARTPGVVRSPEFRRLCKYSLTRAPDESGAAITIPCALLTVLEEVANYVVKPNAIDALEEADRETRARYAKSLKAHRLLTEAALELGLAEDHFTNDRDPLLAPPSIVYECPKDFARRQLAKMEVWVASQMLYFSLSRALFFTLFRVYRNRFPAVPPLCGLS